MGQTGIDQNARDPTRRRIVRRDPGMQSATRTQERELSVWGQPATAFASASARSVRSQVNSGSSRPK